MSIKLIFSSFIKAARSITDVHYSSGPLSEPPCAAVRNVGCSLLLHIAYGEGDGSGSERLGKRGGPECGPLLYVPY